MLRSMTGFGAASGESKGLVVQVEIRSVNHRYLQSKIRIPSEFGALEQKVDALIRKRLNRGSVATSISISYPGGRKATIDSDAARNYERVLTKLSKELKLDGRPELRSILTLPGVVSVDATVGHSAKDTKLITVTAAEALEGLFEMRTREGESLEKDLRVHMESLKKLVAKIETRMPQVVKAVQASLHKRVDALLDGRGSLKDSDLAREVALIADRGDVAEELSRLESHIEQIETRLNKGGAIGKQLDFLVQELVRELNTVGSKCSDSKVAHFVVEGKTAVERMREQVQNVE
ncbi:MAG: hypothetical protein ACI87A_002837 [Planctomycetota bacterium]|jgi:uncharacterized protein (TIGR00255 family)